MLEFNGSTTVKELCDGSKIPCHNFKFVNFEHLKNRFWKTCFNMLVYNTILLIILF